MNILGTTIEEFELGCRLQHGHPYLKEPEIEIGEFFS